MDDPKPPTKPVVKTTAREARDRAALLEALQARPGERFLATALKHLTAGKANRSNGVPKSRVRSLLTGVPGVQVSEDKDGTHYSWAPGEADAAPPKA
jgi:hypothetical protein